MLGFLGGPAVKNPSARPGDTGSSSGSRRSLKRKRQTDSAILAERVPGTEEPGRLRSTVDEESDMNELLTHTYTCMRTHTTRL